MSWHYLVDAKYLWPSGISSSKLKIWIMKDEMKSELRLSFVSVQSHRDLDRAPLPSPLVIWLRRHCLTSVIIPTLMSLGMIVAGPNINETYQGLSETFPKRTEWVRIWRPKIFGIYWMIQNKRFLSWFFHSYRRLALEEVMDTLPHIEMATRLHKDRFLVALLWVHHTLSKFQWANRKNLPVKSTGRMCH